MPHQPLRKRVTLRDVAQESGYSVQTASHVLSGTKSVKLPDATRRAVLEAAQKLGYIPNPMAQAMRSGKTNTIAVWMPIDRPIYGYLRILTALGACAKSSGHDLMILGLDRQSALTTTGRPPHRWPVDGILTVDAEKAVEVFRGSQGNGDIPVAVLGFQQFANSDSVGWNLSDGCREAVERLISRGRRKIVHLTMDWVLAEFPREQRRRGYTTAMDDAGLSPTFLSCCGESSSDAKQAVLQFLDKGGELDGLTVFNDTLAAGAVSALLERGLSVPGDVAVWGHGNYPEAESCVVPISTLMPPITAVVGQAWEWLIERVDGFRGEGRFTSLDMELIERDSTLF